MRAKDVFENNQSERQDAETNSGEGAEIESPLAKEDAGNEAEPSETQEEKAEADTNTPPELDALKQALEKKENEYKDLFEKTQRMAAEYDNFRKRTQKEKERLFSDSACEIVSRFLPAVDNLERALKASETDEGQGFRDGVALVLKQLTDILDKLDVKPIEAIGKTFDPDLHHAVMHFEDENYGANEIIEEFQKGYTYKDEIIIRHAMVKVAN